MSGSDYTLTPHYALFKPIPNADLDTWGDHLNYNADTIDGLLFNFGGLYVAKAGDTMSGPLILSGDPTAPLGAATRQFVTSSISAASANYVAKAGDTMTGPLILSGDPTAPLGAATRQYVTGNFVSKAGDTMTGSLTIGTMAYPGLVLNRPPGGTGDRQLVGTYNGLARWTVVVGNGAAESGGNTGSDFTVNRFNDAGSYIDSPITIARSTGNVYLTPTQATANDWQFTAMANGGTNWARTRYANNLGSWGVGMAASGHFVITDERVQAVRVEIFDDGGFNVYGPANVNSALRVGGNLYTDSSRIISRGWASSPSVGVYDVQNGVASGMWEGGDGLLWFGDCDGSAVPTAGRMYLDRSSSLYVYGSVITGGSVGSGQNMTVGWNLYINGSLGIRYYGASNWIRFRWDGRTVANIDNGAAEVALAHWYDSPTFGNVYCNYVHSNGAINCDDTFNAPNFRGPYYYSTSALGINTPFQGTWFSWDWSWGSSRVAFYVNGSYQYLGVMSAEVQDVDRRVRQLEARLAILEAHQGTMH